MRFEDMYWTNNKDIYSIKNRNIVSSEEWQTISKITEVDDYYATFENDTFLVRPYYWGDDEEREALSNFIHKPTGFEIQWYKYPFRDSYMNKDLSDEQIIEIFAHCVKSLKGEIKDV